MPKVPRDCSHDDIVRALRKNGWKKLREGSRHTIMSLDDREVSVPRHSKLKTGTVAKILKHAEIPASKVKC